jgi:hypothetical protein
VDILSEIKTAASELLRTKDSRRAYGLSLKVEKLAKDLRPSRAVAVPSSHASAKIAAPTTGKKTSHVPRVKTVKQVGQASGKRPGK